MIETINILKGQEKYLTGKIDKMNRKALKINCPEMTLTFGEEFVQKWTDEYGRKHVTVKVPATLDYEIPIIDGWKLISVFDAYQAEPKIQKDIEGNCRAPGPFETIVTTSTVPGETLPISAADKKEIHCDHCGHNRNRNHSMLMQNVHTDEYMEVGSTCIRDFFGHDPVAFMRYASWSFEGMINEIPEEESEFQGGGRVTFLDLKETLIYASATIRKYGWMSKGKAYEQSCGSTADEVIEQMFPPSSMAEADRVKIDDRDKEIAEKTIEYFISNPDLTNDYVNNCNKICRIGYVPFKHLGLTVSMIPSYNRTVFEKKDAAADTSEFVGNTGDKLKDIEAEVVYSKELQGDYGVKVLYIFKGTDGNTYKTFYSGTKWTAYQGDEVIIAGTVKAHNEYKGKKATMLTRCFAKVTKEANEENWQAAEAA